MTTTTKTTEKKIDNFDIAQSEALTALHAAHEAKDAKAELIATMNYKAATAAQILVSNAKWLRDKLNNAIARLEQAKTTTDMYLAASDLNTSLFDSIQTARIELAVYHDVTARN